jgi:hypothetical protein
MSNSIDRQALAGPRKIEAAERETLVAIRHRMQLSERRERRE